MTEPTVVTLHASTAEATIDLAEWISANGIGARLMRSTGSMGVPEAVSLSVAGAAALRAAFMVAREWVRARRTDVDVSVNGTRYTISSSSDIDSLIRLVRSIDDEPDATDNEADHSRTK